MKAEIILSPKEIEDVLRAHLESKGATVSKVKFDVSYQLVGSQMQEHYSTVFKGVKCEVDI